MATKKKAFWLSYDLGLKGDYPGMYRFLDTVKAKECGDSVAFFNKSIEGSADYAQVIKEELKSSVNLKDTDRVYLIHLKDDGTMNGKFINGGRKRSPWEGFALGSSQTEEDS